jgi:hypothetical protein
MNPFILRYLLEAIIITNLRKFVAVLKAVVASSGLWIYALFYSEKATIF